MICLSGCRHHAQDTSISPLPRRPGQSHARISSSACSSSSPHHDTPTMPYLFKFFTIPHSGGNGGQLQPHSDPARLTPAQLSPTQAICPPSKLYPTHGRILCSFIARHNPARGGRTLFPPQHLLLSPALAASLTHLTHPLSILISSLPVS